MPGAPGAPVAQQAPNAMPMPYGHVAANAGQSGTYEFSREQDDTFRKLAGAMKFVGVMFILFGGFGSIIGTIELIAKGHGGNGIVSGLLYMVLGVFTLQGGGAFGAIAATQGNDIPNLMRAVDQLRRFYGTLRVLLILAMVLMALLFVFAIVAMLVVGTTHVR
jgi:hypothetical protein